MKGTQQCCWAEQESSWLDKNCGFFNSAEHHGMYPGNIMWESLVFQQQQQDPRAGLSGVLPRKAPSCGFQTSAIPPASAWSCRRWSKWEMSRAASWALQVGKNYLILASWSRHPLVILSIKQMELILIINDELFASVIMNGGNWKKHSTLMMQKCWLSLNSSSGISFGSIKK